MDDAGYRTEEGEPPMRTLKKVKLQDVSPVTFPAYPQTDVNCRSLDPEWLRRMGFEEERHEPSRLSILTRRLEIEI